MIVCYRVCVVSAVVSNFFLILIWLQAVGQSHTGALFSGLHTFGHAS